MKRLCWLVGAVSLLVAGCNEGNEGDSSTAASPSEPEATATTANVEPVEEPLRPPRCPPHLSNCERASGTILAVQRVDPDGDGDAHFVLASEDSITAPGISVLDVRPDLRPSPLPGPGDQIAGAGPVYEGSFGQRQIEVVAVSIPDASGDR